MSRLLLFLEKYSRCSRFGLRWLTVIIALSGAMGCGTGSSVMGGALSKTAVSGVLHGGQQPISGAKIQLYAVSTGGDGLASTPLLGTTVLTDSHGSFNAGSYVCPTAESLVYLVALGGNPGLGPGVVNNQAGLMAALGPCGAIESSTYVSMNEVTTVASVWTLAPFMSSYNAVGSASSDAEQLTNGFTLANQLVNMATGTSPGASLPANAVVSTPMLYTLANIIAACINSAGGVSGDGSICGDLFADVQGSGPAPANTIDAVLGMVRNPQLNVSKLFNLSSPNSIFSPTLPAVPAAWAVSVDVPAPPVTTGSFHLAGLIDPASVSESIFVLAPTVQAGGTVTYYIDDQSVSTETVAPFWLGGVQANAPFGFSVSGMGTGPHILRAVAKAVDGSLSASNLIHLNVTSSLNGSLSSSLGVYLNQISAQRNSLPSLQTNTTTPGAVLTAQEQQTRQQVLSMYINWGIDPSLDSTNDQSAVLAGLAPTGWAASKSSSATTPLSMLFSPDAPFYQTIPAKWPRVALPSAYIKGVQFNTVSSGDGIGYGQVSASAIDPMLNVRSEWYTEASTLRTYPYRMPSGWAAKLPSNIAGDSHMIFVDPAAGTFVSSYKTTQDPVMKGANALYASPPTSLNSLGDAGGSTATRFAELPVLLQPGEAIDPVNPIPHALGGPVGRTWAARVYPASAWDSGVLTSKNSCTGVGYTNTGLVPYGGLIQLNPALDLTKLHLSLPALRILQAIQTHGYYVMDFGCADFDIYTAISGTELDPYGGVYGNANGVGVQNEIQGVLTSNTLYVVPPLTKKQ